MRRAIRFLRGGSVVELADFAPDATLLDHLRHVDRRTGGKEGCGRGECGSCTVALGACQDGAMAYRPVNACMTLLGSLDGKELVTIEDVSARATRPHPVQEALVSHHASQCGFCTPGMVMALFTLFHSDLTADRRRAAAWLTGNLCRCTGYRPIIDAAVAACARAQPPRRDAFANAARRTLGSSPPSPMTTTSSSATSAASSPLPRAWTVWLLLPGAIMTPFCWPAAATCWRRRRATWHARQDHPSRPCPRAWPRRRERKRR